MGAELSTYSGQSGHVGIGGGHTDRRSICNVGSSSQTGMDVGAGGSRIRLRDRFGRVLNASSTGRDIDYLRGCVRHVSDRLDRF